MKTFRRCCGFTMIEMLTVISVLILLIFILLPSFNRVRDYAKRAACYQNLHNIGIACNSYLADYRLIMVPSAYPEQFPGGFQPQPEMWASLLIYSGYIPRQPIDENNYDTAPPFTRTMFYCPAAAVSLKQRIPFSGARFPNTAYNLFGTYADCWYGINNNTSAGGSNSVSVPVHSYRRMSDFRETRRTVLAYDGYYMHPNMHYIRNNVLVNGAERIQCRHLNTTVDNLLLVDGHAESVADNLVPLDGADFGDPDILRANWNTFIWRLDQ